MIFCKYHLTWNQSYRIQIQYVVYCKTLSKFGAYEHSIFFLTAVAERTKKRKAFANADKEKRVKLLDFQKVQTSSFSESAFCEKMHV